MCCLEQSHFIFEGDDVQRDDTINVPNSARKYLSGNLFFFDNPSQARMIVFHDSRNTPVLDFFYHGQAAAHQFPHDS